MKKFMVLALVLFAIGCTHSKSVKVMGPKNEVLTERDQVNGWGSSADTTKVFTGRDFDRCMYYMQRGTPQHPALDERSAYACCSSGTCMGGVPTGNGGYIGGARGYVPGGGRGNVTVIPDYASGPPTTPTVVGVDPATIVTREEYNADMKRVGDAITEERDQREQDKKKKK